MRGLRTWIVVAAVCALGLAATLDALRAEEERAEPGAEERPTMTREAPEWTEYGGASRAAAAELREERIYGILFWSDRDCRIHAVTLPSLRRHPAPAERSCRFVSSPGGALSVGPAVPDPRGSLVASCDGGTTLELRTRYGMLVAAARACAPAWKPSGVLTAVRDGELVELRLRLRPRRLVARVALSREDLERALGRVPWSLRAPVLEEVAWVDDERLAAIVADEDGGEEVLALFRGRRLLAAPPSPYDDLSALRTSPFRTYIAARVGKRGLVALDERGEFLSLGLRAAHAIAWSPDERWTAVATSDGVFVVPAGERPNRFILLPLAAADVFWR